MGEPKYPPDQRDCGFGAWNSSVLDRQITDFLKFFKDKAHDGHFTTPEPIKFNDQNNAVKGEGSPDF